VFQISENIHKATYPPRREIAGHAIRVAIAYMAARILEDKGFFGFDAGYSN
jgi:hypothetical protein